MSCCVSGARAPGAAPRHVRRQRGRRAPARKRSRPRGQPDGPWRGRNRAPQLRAASRLARQRARRKAPRGAGGAEGRWHMSDSVRIALAQLNLLVGDVQGNAARIIAATRHAHLTLGADLVLFPELTLSGYPPEDLLFHRGFRRQIEEGLARVRRELTDAAVMVGFPEYTLGGIYNSAALIVHGEIAAIHRKAELPNYKVFDENSFFMDARGQVLMRAPPFEEGTYVTEFVRDGRGEVAPQAGDVAPELSDEASIYSALVLGVRDYVRKHGFPGVVVGLSGGIDSALTLAIAVDALGRDCVQAVMMPSRYTSAMSLADAKEQAEILGVHYSVLSIEGMFESTLATLKGEFAGRPQDATEENIQSRCRMLLLMGLSNKTGRMLLTTGNKSEMAVGYATLYGDMAGGFAPIKDCSKLLVYRLCAWRNARSRVIPARVIERPPSAELRFEQKDTDSLPPYEILDPILEAFIEEDLSVDQIAARGFDRATVGRILDLVKRNEYKRRQAPPGVRVSGRAFGRDWRYPITSGYKSH